MLKGQFYLALKKKRYQSLSGRLTQTLPGLDSGEIAIRVDIALPETLFSRPQLRAAITVPEGQLSAPVIDMNLMDNIREVVSQKLGVDLTIAVVEADSAPGKSGDAK